jgi:hypothetical protein
LYQAMRIARAAPHARTSPLSVIGTAQELGGAAPNQYARQAEEDERKEQRGLLRQNRRDLDSDADSRF